MIARRRSCGLRPWAATVGGLVRGHANKSYGQVNDARCDTPDVVTPRLANPDGLSRGAAEAAWHAVTSLITGTADVRMSKDGGPSYPPDTSVRRSLSSGTEKFSG